MNLDRLHEILSETTIQLRKGEAVTESQVGPVSVTTLDFNPPESAAREDLEKVDMVFLTVGVDKDRALSHREELVKLLNEYPEDLQRGPSYIHVGGVLGDQGRAFQLFALGKVLGFWNVITPADFHAEGAEAIQMAGSGFIMIDGYRP